MQFKLNLPLMLLTIPAVLAISLEDISPLNKNEVTLGCLDTYNREISECSKEQFSSGKCTTECTNALNTLGKDIMLACRQAFAGQDTLFRRILDGGIVTTLCANSGDDEETADISSTPTKSTVTKTSSAVEKLETDDAPTTTESSAETETTTGAASEEETDASGTEGSSATETTPAGSQETGGNNSEDNSILGGGGNAAERVEIGKSVLFGAIVDV
ncbi:hypothetical protein BDZ91DRAFT_418655 [Kalaharituber pfeilii]|nr:hypothetical protein BDZ91DRAFT_418655 [Kalaharituber pfeilii]